MARSRSFHDELAAVMARKKVNQAEIVRRTGISQGWVNSMVRNGQIPSRETLGQLADGLDLDSQERWRLYIAAGYHEDREESETPWPAKVRRVADTLCRLRDEELEAVERMADLFVGRRVIDRAAEREARLVGVGMRP